MAVDEVSEIFFLDLAIHEPEAEAYKEICEASALPVSYHSPPLHGMESILKRAQEVKIKGLLVLGSMASVHGKLPWQLGFHPWLESIIKKGVPTFGICYGHQLIAKIFGAKIGFVRGGEKFIGFREVELLEKTALNIKGGHLHIVASHNEEVKDLPQDMTVFARSAEIAFEGLYHNKLPIFTLQSHPEARSDFYNKRGVKPNEADFSDGRRVMKRFLDFAHSF